MNFDAMLAALPKLLEGTATTIELITLSGILGVLLAVPIAIARASPRGWVQSLPLAYIFFLRGTPLLVQIFLVYYGVAQFEAIRNNTWLWPILREPYWCAIIAFTLNTSAYSAEILRGAIQAVPRGEIEAGRALGMSWALLQRRIVLPRALRIALPAYSNEVILMLKGSALASTITLLDLTGMARTIIAKNYLPVETFLAAGMIYLLMTYVITHAFRFAEKRLNRHLVPRSSP